LIGTGAKPAALKRILPVPDSVRFNKCVRFRKCPKRLWWEGKIMADEDLKAEIDRLRAENDALKQSSSKSLSLKVSQKGALSVYGLGRFPVTLYKEQWLRLLEMAEEIQEFIKQNDAQLKGK